MKSASNASWFETELRADLPAVAADRTQLQQVLMNLFMNAIEAMEGDHEP